MNKSMTLIAWLILLPVIAVGATIRVPVDQPTIQSGINVALDGDTVLVAPGTYAENLTVSGKGIVLLSEGGPVVTTLTPASLPANILQYVNDYDQSNTVQGFTFTGVNELHCIESMQGTLIADNCRFIDNILSGEIGGAVMIWNKAAIRNCLFMNNRGAKHGGAIRWVNSGGGVIENNEFRDNSARYGGGVNLLYAGNVIVRFNLFVSDTAEEQGGAIYLGNSSNIRMNNNTIDSCISQNGTGGGIAYHYCANDTSFNNIIINCTGYGIWQVGSIGYMVDYNDCLSNSPSSYFDIVPGSGSLSIDPELVGGVPFNYHLQPASPCINAGNPDPIYNDEDASRSDIGAFKSLANAPYAAAINYGPFASGSTVFTLTPTIYWSFFDTAATSQTGFEIEVGTDANWAVAEMWSSGPVMLPDTSVAYGGLPLGDHQQYFLRIRLYNGIVWGNWVATSFSTRVSNRIYVPGDQPTIQSGINVALDGDTVIVAPGTYAENITVSGKGIVLLSEGGTAVTTLTPASLPSNILHYVNDYGKSNTVQGFTFTGVNELHCIESMQGTLIADNCRFIDNILSGEIGGAVMIWNKATIRNCQFMNNSGAKHGGAIRWVNSGGGVIENNEFRDNSARYGGGVNLLYAGNVIVSYNLFVNNASEDQGGAIYLGNSSNIRMNNNTIDSCISQNGTGGGISYDYCTNDTSINNIIVNCTGYGIWRMGSSGYMVDYNDCFSNSPSSYSDIVPGSGSLSAYPQFVGGTPFSYHLQVMSPCIDAGNPDPLYNDADGTRNDMGRYSHAVIIGDANGDGSINISDVVFLINYIFMGGSAPQPLLTGDPNCDGSINIADVVYLINYVFAHGPAPCAAF
jgi:hypothetical protein